MVRRSTPGPASGSRRAAPRPRGLIASTAATAAASAVLALALAAIAPLASLPSSAAGAPTQCADSRELLAAAPGLEGADPGHLIACVDEDHRRLTIHNRTPVVWAIGDPSVTGVVDQAGGVSGLLSSHASRSGRGLLLAPGASASVSAGPGRIAPRPDREATRLHLALTAIVEAQDAAEATLPPAGAQSGAAIGRAHLRRRAERGRLRMGDRLRRRTRTGRLDGGMRSRVARRRITGARGRLAAARARRGGPRSGPAGARSGPCAGGGGMVRGGGRLLLGRCGATAAAPVSRAGNAERAALREEDGPFGKKFAVSSRPRARSVRN